MALQAQNVSGAFKKRAPGLEPGPLSSGINALTVRPLRLPQHSVEGALNVYACVIKLPLGFYCHSHNCMTHMRLPLFAASSLLVHPGNLNKCLVPEDDLCNAERFNRFVTLFCVILTQGTVEDQFVKSVLGFGKLKDFNALSVA